MIYKDHFTLLPVREEQSLQHHGILGQKWGVRRFQNADGTLTAKGKARKEKEFNKEVQKRSTDIFIKSNNDAADKINGKWIEDFNSKWEKKFTDDKPWDEQKSWESYIEDYTNNLVKFMDESVCVNPNATFITFDGEKYVARYLKEYGQQVVWASEQEWKNWK